MNTNKGLTTRQRIITIAAARASATLRREAELNDEQPWQATDARIAQAVGDALSIDSRAHRYCSARLIAPAIRKVKESIF